MPCARAHGAWGIPFEGTQAIVSQDGHTTLRIDDSSLLWVISCLAEEVSITAAAPQIAADLLHARVGGVGQKQAVRSISLISADRCNAVCSGNPSKPLCRGTSIQPDDLAAIDEWAAKHGCTRSEAVRRLAKLGLLADRKDDLEQ
jgi:hypothetical protein